MNDKPIVIAVLDDEAKMCTALGRLLRGYGYEVASFESGEVFLAAEPERPFACILLDLNMAGMNGFDVMKALVRKGTHPPVVVITGRDEPGNKDHVLGLGASAYLTKPVDETSLLKAIELCLLGETPLN